MIDSRLLAEMRVFCEKMYPEEGCGLIVGLPGRSDSDRVVSCSNIQNTLHESSPEKYGETAGEAYSMDPDELLGLLVEMEKRREVLKAIFHSHPDSEASFSAKDYEHAVRFTLDGAPSSTAGMPEPVYSGVLQIIISVNNGVAGEVKIYAWDYESKVYVEKL